MQKLQKYKKTELGDIPEEWDLCSLIDFVDGKNNIVAGPFGSNLKVIDYKTHGVPIIRLQNIERNRFINENIRYISQEKAEELKYHSYRQNDIVLAKLGDPIGKTCIIPEHIKDGIVVADVVRIRPSLKKSHTKFLEYALNSDFCSKQMNGSSIGTTRPRVNLDQIRYLKLFKPPLKEQQKIASILSNVDELIQKTEQIIKQTQILKKGLMQRLLTKGIGHTKFKKVALSKLNVRLTPIPYEWEIKTLNDIAIINPESINEKYPYDEIYYIEIGAISNYQIQEYVTHNLSKRPSRAQRMVRKGDIIVSTVRPYLRGFTLITDNRSNLICSTGFAVIRPKNKEDENFIFNYIKSKLFENNIFRHMEGMAYPAITSSDVANAIIPYPNDKKEMMKIGSLLYKIDSSLKLKYSYKLELQTLKKGLMQQLLTGKIRVKV
jgi:type I restriction enzyme S subunit